MDSEKGGGVAAGSRELEQGQKHWVDPRSSDDCFGREHSDLECYSSIKLPLSDDFGEITRALYSVVMTTS